MGEDNDTLLNRKRDSVWACVYVCVGGGGVKLQRQLITTEREWTT